MNLRGACWAWGADENLSWWCGHLLPVMRPPVRCHSGHFPLGPCLLVQLQRRLVQPPGQSFHWPQEAHGAHPARLTWSPSTWGSHPTTYPATSISLTLALTSEMVVCGCLLAVRHLVPLLCESWRGLPPFMGAAKDFLLLGGCPDETGWPDCWGAGPTRDSERRGTEGQRRGTETKTWLPRGDPRTQAASWERISWLASSVLL